MKDKKKGIASSEIYAMVLLSLINLLMFADQNLMAPNLTEIARSFGFTDVQRDTLLGGNISFWYWVVGGVTTLAVGYLADRFSRKRLFIAVMLIGTIPCFMTGFVETYTQLVIARALTGIRVGAAIPLTFSLLGDYFSAKARAAMAGLIGFSMGVGIAGGQLLAGFSGGTFGWRAPFIMVAVPAFLVILLFWLTIREPKRGQSEESLKELLEQGKVYSAKINFNEYINLFKIKTNLLIFIQGIPGCIPWGVFFIYLNDFLAQEKGFSVEVATLVVMGMGVAIILGGFIGGLIGSKLYALKSVYLPVFCAATTIAAVIPVFFVINYPPQIGIAHPSIVPLVVTGFVGGFLMSITGPNINAMMLNVNSPETRGSIFALLNLTDGLGKGFGPVVISLLIAAFHQRALAFNIANFFWILCGVIILITVFTLPKDEARLNALMKERAAKLSE